jgi:hypothetical protein
MQLPFAILSESFNGIVVVWGAYLCVVGLDCLAGPDVGSFNG